MKVNKVFRCSQYQSSAGAYKKRYLMHYLTVVILTAVFVNPILAMANNGTPVECTSADLTIVGKNGGQDFLYKIRDDLIVKVTGPCITKVKAELSKPAESQALKLLLAGVKMTGLDISTHQTEKDKNIIFGFNLDRKPNEKENREAWDKLLRKQADYVMN
ncbi:MAG: hypothetical protein L0Z73_09095, partial [Gammaproteobacteria bacterium]|nr:hypothetical protein [Gammaproteobacteria bacterium]